MKSSACAIVLITGILCGDLAAKASEPPLFQLLSRTNVIVRIEGKETTKGDIERDAKVLMTLAMNKSRRTKVETGDLNFFRSFCRSAAQISVEQACRESYAREHGLTNSAAMLSGATHLFERRYGAYSKKLKRRHSIDDLKFMLGTNGRCLDAYIHADATYRTVTNHLLSTHPIEITDAMVNDRISAIRRENESRLATNAWVYARATNVWRKITSHEMTFEQAATNYSQDVYLAMGCEWGSFTRENLAEDPAVLALLPSLKAGDITPPVESDYGLAILRLDEIDEDGRYTFSRVFFRLPIIFDIDSPEEARAYLHQKAERDLIHSEMNAIKSKLNIEYPSGTNLFAAGSSLFRVTNEDLKD